MKKSIFSYEKKKGDYTYYFNTLSRTLIKSKCHDQQKLAKYGFYVEDDFDEYKQLVFDYYRQCYNSKYFSITYLMTNACNFRCTYCFESELYKTNKEIYKINSSEFYNICKYIVNKEHIEYLDVNFFGGEPLIKYNELIATVKKINTLGCKCSYNIVTNGYLLNPDRIVEMKKCGISSMQITIDGCRENHDKYRVLKNGKPTYELIMKNTILAIKEGIEVIVNITYSNDNFYSIDKFLREFPLEYKDKVYIKFTRLLDLDKSDVEIMGKLYVSLKQNGFRTQDITHLEYGPCMNKLKNSLLVHADGKLSKCIFDVGEFSLGYAEFNADYNNIDKFLFPKKFNINKMAADCLKCRFLPMCKGDCDRRRYSEKKTCRKDYFESVANAIIEYYGDSENE